MRRLPVAINALIFFRYYWVVAADPRRPGWAHRNLLASVPMLRWALLATALLAPAQPALGQRFDGFNVIVAPDHPFGSASARQSLETAKRAGAAAIAVVPFVWQRDPRHSEIVRGADMPDAELRLAIREARALGLKVMVKAVCLGRRQLGRGGEPA